MTRVHSAWKLALTIALSACDDDASRTTNDDCTAKDDCEAIVDAGSKRDARADAARRDAGPVDGTPDAEETQPSARDAAADARAPDAGKDAGPRDAAEPSSDAGSSSASDAAAPGDAAAGDSLDALRQVCLDTINMYRATMNLPAMMRATATSESCSDDGAEFDSKAGQAHGSAAQGAVPCRTASVAQNTCPNWPVRPGGSVADSLKQCLAQMWAEGEPPGGVDACVNAYFQGDTACFLAHGHYINMISDNRFVSCGFYENAKQQWWMNQDFTLR